MTARFGGSRRRWRPVATLKNQLGSHHARMQKQKRRDACPDQSRDEFRGAGGVASWGWSLSSSSSSHGKGLPRAGGVNCRPSTSSAAMPVITPTANPTGIRKEVPSWRSSQPPRAPGRSMTSTTAKVRESHCIDCSQIACLFIAGSAEKLRGILNTCSTLVAQQLSNPAHCAAFPRIVRENKFRIQQLLMTAFVPLCSRNYGLGCFK